MKTFDLYSRLISMELRLVGSYMRALTETVKTWLRTVDPMAVKKPMCTIIAWRLKRVMCCTCMTGKETDCVVNMARDGTR